MNENINKEICDIISDITKKIIQEEKEKSLLKNEMKFLDWLSANRDSISINNYFYYNDNPILKEIYKDHHINSILEKYFSGELKAKISYDSNVGDYYLSFYIENKIMSETYKHTSCFPFNKLEK